MAIRRQKLFKYVKPMVYFVTPNVEYAQRKHLMKTVKDAIIGGVNMVQLRNKILMPRVELQMMAKEMHMITQEYQVPFIINDDVALALEIGAEGAHIGQEDMAIQDAIQLIDGHRVKEFLLGVTVRNPEEAQRACQAGAGYLGVGPVFVSSTKKNANGGVAIGLEMLQQTAFAAREFQVPIVAIGGITKDTAEDCMRAQASGVAVVAAISSAMDVQNAAKELRAKVSNGWDAFHR